MGADRRANVNGSGLKAPQAMVEIFLQTNRYPNNQLGVKTKQSHEQILAFFRSLPTIQGATNC